MMKREINLATPLFINGECGVYEIYTYPSPDHDRQGQRCFTLNDLLLGNCMLDFSYIDYCFNQHDDEGHHHYVTQSECCDGEFCAEFCRFNGLEIELGSKTYAGPAELMRAYGLLGEYVLGKDVIELYLKRYLSLRRQYLQAEEQAGCATGKPA